MSEAPETSTPDQPADDAASSPLRDRVIATLKTCYDPEIPVDIYELGLIYDVDVEEPTRQVAIRMTLTTPMCPVAETLPPEVESKVRAMEGVAEAKVEVVWDPPWGPEMMSEAARLDLNM
ncbi:MAG: SUF system Fe-S cluster assembly protein [Myxococcales bacterium]|nr:SUF system Fe-S cluster assembly protein [Myxococcales bacterium]